jgi:hypothetical protein
VTAFSSPWFGSCPGGAASEGHGEAKGCPATEVVLPTWFLFFDSGSTESAGMKIQMWSVDRVIPYKRNPQRNEDAVEKVATSLKPRGKTRCL